MIKDGRNNERNKERKRERRDGMTKARKKDEW